jgi:hypothetical protein
LVGDRLLFLATTLAHGRELWALDLKPKLVVEQPAGTALATGATVSWGTGLVGQRTTKTFIIRNTGDAPLRNLSLTLDPPAGTGFAVESSDLGTTLDPGTSATVVLAFQPSTGGPLAATLRLLSNDPTQGSFSVNLQGTGNTTPTFAGFAAATAWQTPASITSRKLLTKAADVDGDTLTVSAAGPASSNSGTAVLQASAILYTPPNNFSGTDTFPVTISDSRGGSVTGTVTVTVGAPPNSSGGSGSMTLNPPQLSPQPGGSLDVSFRGIPGRAYQIQRSTDLTIWTTVAAVTASATGTITWTDPAPPQPDAYYRLALP